MGAQRRPAVLLVDFDGVVVDSEVSAAEAWQAEFSRFGLAFDWEQWSLLWADQVTNRTALMLGMIAERTAKRGIEFDPAVSLVRVRVKRARFERRPIGRSEVCDFLRRASGFGIPWTIVSNNRESIIRRAIHQLSLPDPLYVVSAIDSGIALKPSPAIYREALRKLNVTADQALALEDSPAGVASALAHGIPTLVVRHRLNEALVFPANTTDFGFHDPNFSLIKEG